MYKLELPVFYVLLTGLEQLPSVEPSTLCLKRGHFLFPAGTVPLTLGEKSC